MDERIHVLHVEDDPAFADLVAAFLEQEHEGLSVETATNPAEGWERLSAGTFDCVVSDYDMPGETGVAFLERVREAYPDLPFILYTGKGSEEVAGVAISAGVTDYLQKGSGTDQYELLANKISNAVARMRAGRELVESDRRFRAVFEDPLSVIAILAPDGTLLDVNATALGRVGEEREDVLGDPFWDEPWWRPEKRAAVREWVDRAATGEYVEFEAAHTTPDGKVWHVLATLRPVVDEMGDVVSLIASGKDVTETKRHERELQARRRQQEVVAELGGRALLGTDPATLLELATAEVKEALGVEYVALFEVRPDEEACLLRAGVGWHDGNVGETTVTTGRGSWAGHALRSSSPVVVDDFRTDDRFEASPPLTTHDIVSGVGVVVGTTENPWGTLWAFASEPRVLTEHDGQFVRSVANVLAGAVRE
jgi:PAS domain S-box-containing protein